MSESLAQLRGRQQDLAARLAVPGAAAERAALRAELAALYRAVEAELAGLAALKGDVLSLIDRWKTLPAGDAPAPAPQDGGPSAPDPAAPPTRAEAVVAEAPGAVVQADHLGASTFIERGWHQISAGDAAAAEASLRRALDLSPGDAQAGALLGWAQMLQGRHDDALLVLQGVLLRDPDHALARASLGYVRLKQGAFKEAIEQLSRAIRLDDDRRATLYAHLYLGLVYLERDMFEDAQRCFRRSLALGPNLVEAYYELGRALWFGGEPEQARRTWREGVQANKFSPWGKRCAELLQAVEEGAEPARRA